jgi:hypothetical protein
MTRMSQTLALLASLVALAATAPTASAAMKSKANEPAGIRHGSVTPNPFRIKAYEIRSHDPNPLRRIYKPQRRHFR